VVDVRQEGRSVLSDGVTPDADRPVEVTINLQGGTVRGAVRNAASEPGPRTEVTLIPATAARRGIPVFYKRTEVDSRGQFTFRGVAPGDYKIFAWSALPPGQPEENPQFLAPYEARGSTVTAAAGRSVSVELPVIPLP
jgi:hypothetical protein